MLIEFDYTLRRGLKEHDVKVTAKLGYYHDNECLSIDMVELHGREVYDFVSDIEIGLMTRAAWDYWKKNKKYHF